MSDIRLQEVPFQFDGKTFLLRCNMNVLMDVQEVFGGSISGALSGENASKSVLEFLAAMLNDYADEQGWPKRYSSRDIGRKLSLCMLPTADVMRLVRSAMILPNQNTDQESEPNTGDPGSSGN